MRVAQEGDREFVVQAVWSGAGHELVQRGEGVAHRTPARTDGAESTPGATGTFSWVQSSSRYAMRGSGGTSRKG